MKMKKTYVIGHKNPDTDSICSAIAYANLKQKIEGQEFKAKRAGKINEETQYVLDKFHVDAPPMLSNVFLQVKDVELNQLKGIKSSVSIKEAWRLMKENSIRTIPIIREDMLEGLITAGDIATSYMDVYDSNALAVARTQYRNIVETLDGTMLTGNEHGYFLQGKVVIAASSPEIMEEYIEKDDLVILGNRYESQLCAIEMNASCLIVCQGAAVTKTILKMAREREIVVISTPHDTFTAARLINQSIPVKYFMTKDNLVTFQNTDYVEDIKEIMAKKRFRDFPVLDKRGRFVGFVSRRRILDASRKQVILVDHNEKSQAVDGIDEADIVEIVDHHRLGNIETSGPVYFRNQPVGCTATIVYQMYQEHEVEVDEVTAALLCSAILSDTLMFRSPTCTRLDEKSAQELAKICHLDIEEHAKNMFNAGSNLKGKTAKEICFQDFKRFTANGIDFGVGQINSMSQDELDEIKEKVEPYMQEVLKTMDQVYFMLTNIIEESTEILCAGNGAKGQIIDAFDLPNDQEKIYLKGVVSRKKQLIPVLVEAMSQ